MPAHAAYVFRQAFSDVRHRYAGTGLGWVWNVAHPLATIAIYSLVFGRVFRPTTDRWQYTLYLCCGFFPWLAFCDCVNRGCTSLVDGANYLKKLPIPEIVFPARAAAAACIALGINFTLLMIVAAVTSVRPTAIWILLPIPLLALLSLGFGLGVLLGTLHVFFRDIAQSVVVSLQLIFWTVPIVYQTPTPPWLRFHPLMPAVQAVHDLFLNRTLPGPLTWTLLLAWPAVTIVLGLIALRLLRSEIRDVI